MKFEINLIFLIKLFYYMMKKSRQKFKYLENKKTFWGDIESLFHHKGALSCQKLSQTWEYTFNDNLTSMSWPPPPEVKKQYYI